jgi:hypothetical protein
MSAFWSKLAVAWMGLPPSDRVAIVLAIVAVGLIIYQTSLMILQTDLMKRQLRILEGQQAILQRQLAQRAEFALTYALRHQADDTFLIEFHVKNTGTKSANGFYWRILTPINEFHELLRPEITAPVFPVATHVELEAVKYRQTEAFRPEPLYPGRDTLLAVSYLFKEKARVPFCVWWQISSESGLAPNTGELGKVTVAL